MGNTSYPAFDQLSMMYGPQRPVPYQPSPEQQREDAYRGRANSDDEARTQAAAQDRFNQGALRDLGVRGREVTMGGMGGSAQPGRRSRSKNLSLQQDPAFMDGFGNQMPASVEGDRMRLERLGILGIGSNPGALRYSIGGGVVPRGTIPQFANGGIMQQTGPAIVGEQGPELVRLPAGAEVEPIENEAQYHRLHYQADPSARVGSNRNPLVLTDNTLQGEIEKERGLPIDQRLYGLTPGLGSDNTGTPPLPNMADFLRGGVSMSDILRQQRLVQSQRDQLDQAQSDALVQADAPAMQETQRAKSRYDQLIPLLNEFAQNASQYVPGMPSNKQPGVIASTVDLNRKHGDAYGAQADRTQANIGNDQIKAQSGANVNNSRARNYDVRSDEVQTQSPYITDRIAGQAQNQWDQAGEHGAKRAYEEAITDPTVNRITQQAATEGTRQDVNRSVVGLNEGRTDQVEQLTPALVQKALSAANVDDQTASRILQMLPLQQATEQARAGNYNASANRQDSMADQTDAMTPVMVNQGNARTAETQQRTTGMREKLPYELNELDTRGQRNAAQAAKAGKNPASQPSGMKPKEYIDSLRDQQRPFDAKIARIDKTLNDLINSPPKGSAEDVRLRAQRDEADAKSKAIEAKINEALAGQTRATAQTFNGMEQGAQADPNNVQADAQLREAAQRAVDAGKFPTLQEAISFAQRSR